MSAELRPNPGPQERFLSTSADIAVYGGAAGSGKSFAVALDIVRHVNRPKFGAVVFRRESTRLVGSGSIWEETCGIYPSLGATSRESPVLEWRFPSGALIELRHLQHAKDAVSHSGKQYAGIYFDELTEFEESQFWFLLSRNRSTCGIRPYIRATCNPDPDSFVRKLIDWWIGEDGFPIPARSGVLRWFIRDGNEIVWADSPTDLVAKYPGQEPLSFTFIAALLADNPKGDPTYRAKLMALPLVERERLLGGNWNVRPAAGLLFKRPWFSVIDRLPPQVPVVHRVRAWDKAATEPRPGKDPDWTEGIRVALLKDVRLVVEHLESTQSRPRDIDALMQRTAANDGIEVEQVMWRDGGQAGIVDVMHSSDKLVGYRFSTVLAAKSKVVYAGPVSSSAENGKILVMRAPWNERFFNQLEAFPSKAHDDIVDALSLAHLRLMGDALSLEQQASAYSKGW